MKIESLSLGFHGKTCRHESRSIDMSVQNPFMSKRGSADSRRLLAMATVASIVLAFIPGAELVTYPIRLFSTIVHEGGHALAALVTLGHVEKIVIDQTASGVTTTLGGTAWVILMSGCLG